MIRRVSLASAAAAAIIVAPNADVGAASADNGPTLIQPIPATVTVPATAGLVTAQPSQPPPLTSHPALATSQSAPVTAPPKPPTSQPAPASIPGLPPGVYTMSAGSTPVVVSVDAGSTSVLLEATKTADAATETKIVTGTRADSSSMLTTSTTVTETTTVMPTAATTTARSSAAGRADGQRAWEWDWDRFNIVSAQIWCACAMMAFLQ